MYGSITIIYDTAGLMKQFGILITINLLFYIRR